MIYSDNKMLATMRMTVSHWIFMNYDPLLSLSSLGHYHLNVFRMKMRENTHFWDHGQVKSSENYIGEIVERGLEKEYRMSYLQIFLRSRGKETNSGFIFSELFQHWVNKTI